MNEQNKKQIIIAGVLGVVLVGVLVYQLVLAGDPPPGGDGSTTTDKKPATTEGRSERPAARSTVATPSVLAITELDIEELTRSVEVQPINYAQVRVRRNPMEPLVGIPGVVEGPGVIDNVENGEVRPVARRRDVTGIIWDSRRPVAIIDNIVVHEGYVFADGVVVHEIEPTRVLLKIGESISPLEMKEF